MYVCATAKTHTAKSRAPEKSTNLQRVKTRLYQLVSSGRGSLNDLLHRPQYSLHRHQSCHCCTAIAVDHVKTCPSRCLLPSVAGAFVFPPAWLRGRRILYTLHAQNSCVTAPSQTTKFLHVLFTPNKLSKVVQHCLDYCVFFCFVRFCIATGYHYCVCNLESAVTSSRLKTRCDAHSFCLHTSHKQLRV